jgi:hypothetical protein
MEQLQWCLYLPGFCVHVVPATPHRDELHHVLPNLTDTLIVQPFHARIHEHLVSKHPSPPNHSPSSVMSSPASIPAEPGLPELAKLISHDKAFENTSTSVAASQMRNALNNLADTVKDPEQKKVRGASASPYWFKTDVS